MLQRFPQKLQPGSFANNPFSSWTGTDYCTFEGVTCDASRARVTVDLSGRGLTGRMPQPNDNDAPFAKIVSVDLSNNPGIGSGFESDWKSMTKLERLDLSGTGLHDQIPRDWQRMTSLKYLNLYGTEACHDLPQWDGSQYLLQLETLYLSNCNLHGMIPLQWARFGITLATVNLYGNNLCGCLPSGLSATGPVGAAAVKAQPFLAASNCNVVNGCGEDSGRCDDIMTPQQNTLKFIQRFTNEFDSLRTTWTGDDYCVWPGVTCDAATGEVSVNLANQNLDGDMPEIDRSIDGSKVLVVSMDLSGNPRLGDFEEDWGRLKRLRTLNVSVSGIGGSLPDEWMTMSALESLDVHGTGACRNLPNWQLPSIQSLGLSDCSFYCTLRASWSIMPSLALLKLGGNHFCSCVPTAWQSSAVLAATVISGAVLAALVPEREHVHADVPLQEPERQ